MLSYLSTSLAPWTSSYWDHLPTSAGVVGVVRGGFQQCWFISGQAASEELKLEAAAKRPGLTQPGREKGRKTQHLSGQGRIQPTPGEMYCLERSFLHHAGTPRIRGYLRDPFGKSSCMLKVPKFCTKTLTVPNPLFLNMRQKPPNNKNF